jgi:hypothetical protein
VRDLYFSSSPHVSFPLSRFFNEKCSFFLKDVHTFPEPSKGKRRRCERKGRARPPTPARSRGPLCGKHMAWLVGCGRHSAAVKRARAGRSRPPRGRPHSEEEGTPGRTPRQALLRRSPPLPPPRGSRRGHPTPRPNRPVAPHLARPLPPPPLTR